MKKNTIRLLRYADTVSTNNDKDLKGFAYLTLGNSCADRMCTKNKAPTSECKCLIIRWRIPESNR